MKMEMWKYVRFAADTFVMMEASVKRMLHFGHLVHVS